MVVVTLNQIAQGLLLIDRGRLPNGPPDSVQFRNGDNIALRLALAALRVPESGAGDRVDERDREMGGEELVSQARRCPAEVERQSASTTWRTFQRCCS